jgi:hypothetical protein
MLRQTWSDDRIMTDKQVLNILSEGFPIAAVLLSRGGWLSAAKEVEIHQRFEAGTEGYGIVWRIDLLGEPNEPYHSIYATAETIIGISCKRTRPYDTVAKRHPPAT